MNDRDVNTNDYETMKALINEYEKALDISERLINNYRQLLELTLQTHGEPQDNAGQESDADVHNCGRRRAGLPCNRRFSAWLRKVRVRACDFLHKVR